MSEQSTQSAELAAPAQMFQLILSFMMPQAIHVAAKLGIADILARTPVTADELAAATSSHAPSLRRLLKFLTSVGVFSEDAAGKYQQTPLSNALRRDHPQSVRGMAIAFGSPFFCERVESFPRLLLPGNPRSITFSACHFSNIWRPIPMTPRSSTLR